jgi:hypothetical protein
MEGKFMKANDELRDSIKDDMEVETEPNVYEQYEEYVTQVEVKQSDDISAEVEDEKNVDVISRFIYYGVKTPCL